MLAETGCARDEMSRPWRHQALTVDSDGKGVAHPLHGAKVITGDDERWDRGVAKDFEIGARLAWASAPVRSADPTHDLLGQRTGLGDRCPRDLQEPAQCDRIGVKSVCEDRVTHLPKPGHLRIVVRDEERRLNDRERPHLVRTTTCGDQGSERSIRVGHDVRASVKERNEITRVDLEVLTSGDWRRTRRIATSMGKEERPTS